MSEEEIIDILEDRDMLIDTLYENYKQSVIKPFDKAIQGLLDLYNKEKEKNIAIEIYRKDMPKDTKLIIMRKEDFDRNFSKEYIHRDKIKEIIKDLDEYDNIQMLKDVTKNTLQKLLEED